MITVIRLPLLTTLSLAAPIRRWASSGPFYAQSLYLSASMYLCAYNIKSGASFWTLIICTCYTSACVRACCAKLCAVLCAVPWSVSCAVPCCAMLCYTVLCAVLCCVLCCIVLCCAARALIIPFKVYICEGIVKCRSLFASAHSCIFLYFLCNN